MNRPITPGTYTAADETPAREPEDILAYMVYALGYWPEESLMLVSATDTELRGCARIDLPSRSVRLQEWADGLHRIIETLAVPPATTRMFAAVFTSGSGLEPFATEETDTTSPTRPGCSREAEGVSAMMVALRRCADIGLTKEGLWVVDRGRGSWGSVVDEFGLFPVAPGDGRTRSEARAAGATGQWWPIVYGGETSAILESPLGTALAFRGLVVREQEMAVMDDRRLPGRWDLASAIGDKAAGSLKIRYRGARDRSRRPARRRPGCPPCGGQARSVLRRTTGCSKRSVLGHRTPEGRGLRLGREVLGAFGRAVGSLVRCFAGRRKGRPERRAPWHLGFAPWSARGDVAGRGCAHAWRA